jgi:hypothetical protein
MRTSASLPLYQFADVDNTRKSPIWTASPTPFLAKCTLGRDDQPLHGAGGQRAKAADDAAVSKYSVKAIVDCIHQRCGNGYIWHTTGSGKTLTSFKASTLLNDTKPYGNILDFRQQQDAVDTAIGLFSGQAGKPAKEIWLVDPAPVVIEKYRKQLRRWSSI